MDGDGAIFVGVHFLKKKLDLILGDARVNVLQKVTEEGEGELLLVVDSHAVEQLVEVDVLGVDLETQFSHHHLQLVLELLILDCILVEESLEDGVQKDLVPSQPALLIYLKALLQEVLGVAAEVRIDLHGLGLNVSDQLELSLSREGGLLMEQLVEDEADCPDVALRGVGLRLQDLDGHIKRSADRRRVFDAFGYVLLGEPEIPDLDYSLAKHDIGWLEVSG